MLAPGRRFWRPPAPRAMLPEAGLRAPAGRVPVETMLLRTAFLASLVLAASTRGAAGETLRPPVADDARCGVRLAAAPASGAVVAGGPPACFACPETVAYRTFDGRSLELVRFTGRDTELLLPAAWLDAGGFDDARRRLFLDRADFVYRHAAELLGREPGGDARLAIALVDATCGYGCGNVGSKGIEVVATEQSKEEILGDLAAGVLPRIVVHEMAHNFDLLNRDLWEGMASTFDFHAWTSFFEPYLGVYTRMGSTTASPDEVLLSSLASTYGVYRATPDASFTRCIAETACGPEPGTANRAWAGVTLRFAELHGVETVRAFLAALARIRAERGPPTTLQEKADLHVEAMAEGAGSDLACYADAWRWSISEALRTRLAGLPAEPRCADGDGDGTSPLLGDCDDGDEARHPGAVEVADGVDQDCNGVVDDLRTSEDAEDFSGALLSFPARVLGSLGEGDVDDFWISVPEDGPVSFELCSRGLQGWLFVYDGPRWLGYQYTPLGQCSRRSYALTGGLWRVAVEINAQSVPGDYALAIGPGVVWPETLEAPAEPAVDQCRLVVGFAPPAGAKPLSPDRVRFFASGLGFVAEPTKGAPSRAAFWPGEAGAGPLRLRAQAFAGRTPVSDWTSARSVTIPTPPGVECAGDADGDGIATGNDACPLAPDPLQEDADRDGVGDACDRCTAAPDGPLWPDAGGAWQRDTDGDGAGNACDADFDGDGIVNFRDLARMKGAFFRTDPDVDLDGDGVVNFRDLTRLKTGFLKPPGPSAAR